MDSVAGGPVLQLLGRLAEIFQELAVEEHHLARGTQGTYKPGNAIDDKAKALLVRPEGLLGTFPLFEIGVRAVPLDDPSRFVQQGIAAEEKPAECTVAAAEPALHLERLSGVQGFLERLHHGSEIVWMNRDLPARIQRLVRREAGIVQPALIEEVGGTVRTSRPRQHGDRVDHKANVRCLPSLFGTI